jgi:cytochrome c oxidase subunit II
VRRARTLAFVAGVVGAFGLAGCNSAAQNRSAINAAGPAARILAALGLPVCIGFVVVSAIMWGLIAWVAMRRTGSFDEHAPVDAEGGMSWLLIGGFVIPGIVVTGLFVATIAVMRVFPLEHGVKSTAEIRVTGQQWWWRVDYLDGAPQDYFQTANEIHIPVGRPIELELDTRDVIHSFWVPRLHGKVDLVPGVANHIRIQADEPGLYPGECAEFCGLQHAKMRFVVVAEPKDAYEEWKARQRQPAATPIDPAAMRGRKIFMGGPCPMCHSVRGTEALASFGPNLTHFGSRKTLAAGWEPNQLASLHGWIVNAQGIKPGAKMPALTFFRGAELRDLAAYLEALK